MKAAPEAQRRLLDLQTVDTTIAQLQHRRRQLPEHAQIARAQAERAALGERITAVKTRVFDLEQEQAKAEADLVPVRQRRERDQQRVSDGSITDGKQLRALVDEIDHLGRRIGDLEDAQLDIMERLEAAQAELAELTARRASGDDALRALLGARDAQLAELDAELAQASAERATIAATLPADLLAAYTRTAERSGGTGAALLKAGRCGGCQLQLNTADLERHRAAAPDEVLRCEECNRILVRTPESGL
nr:hypothetical protein [Propionibacterium sp.]